MKVYVHKEYNVYTEENINEKITELLENNGYDGVFKYLKDNFTQKELLDILNPELQVEIFESLKEEIIEEEFYVHDIDAVLCPHLNCPCIK